MGLSSKVVPDLILLEPPPHVYQTSWAPLKSHQPVHISTILLLTLFTFIWKNELKVMASGELRIFLMAVHISHVINSSSTSVVHATVHGRCNAVTLKWIMNSIYSAYRRLSFPDLCFVSRVIQNTDQKVKDILWLFHWTDYCIYLFIYLTYASSTVRLEITIKK